MRSASLAKAGSADVVAIPVIKGKRSEVVEMLVGPASQLILEDAGDDPGAAFADLSYQEEIDGRCSLIDNPPNILPGGSWHESASMVDDF